MRRGDARRPSAAACGLGTLLAAASLLVPGAVRGQEAGFLTVTLARQLAEAAMNDAVRPIGGVLGKIGPSGGASLGPRGFGYVSFSMGMTGLKLEITNPDYTKSASLRTADTLVGPMGAAYLDAEVGLFRGYRTDALEGVLGTDLLLRFGTSIGDIEVKDGSFTPKSAAPIFGVGARIQALEGRRIPALSVIGGVSRFTERSITATGTDDGTPFRVRLDYYQSSAFLLAEAAERWGPFGIHAGAGTTWQEYHGDLDADVVVSGGGPNETEKIVSAKVYRKRLNQLLGGIELGEGTVSVVMEGGLSGGDRYGSFFVRITPHRGGPR